MLEYDILNSDRPMVYDIGVGTDNSSLIISIHNEVLQKVAETLSQPLLLLDSLQQELGLPQFINPRPDWL